MKELILFIAQALVDQPEKVEISEIQGGHCTVFELKVAKSDIAKIIGRDGRTVQAMRTILNSISAKIKKRLVLEVLEEKNESLHFAQEGRPKTTSLKVKRRSPIIEYLPNLSANLQ